MAEICGKAEINIRFKLSFIFLLFLKSARRQWKKQFEKTEEELREEQDKEQELKEINEEAPTKN